VPYGEAGKRLVADLFAKRDKSEFVKLLREAQKYSVNVYPHLVERLRKAGALNEPLEGTGVLCLDPQYYSPHFGISDEPVTELEFLCP
jgi:CRISPR-associated endonuclease/helicase Cas3